MTITGITLVGLGPGNPSSLTLEAWQLLESSSEIYLRTEQHPAVQEFPSNLQVRSFDYLYESSPSYEQIYASIIEQVLALGSRPEGVVYGVPGHPFIAEATCPEIARRARNSNIPLRVVDGLGFIGPVFSALGVDPFPHTVLVDALELASAHVPAFPPDAPALIAQLYSRPVTSEVKLTLMEVYPDEHLVTLVHAAGTSNQIVEPLKLYEIDRSLHIGLLTTLYLPPLRPGCSFEAFQEMIAHLRAPEGCPWDREQTHQTLRSHLLEETYEALAALDADDPLAMCEEFGDLLLQIVLHAQIAGESREFRMADIIWGIYDKIKRRHPHVFGDLKLADADSVIQNWERLKASERASSGQAEKSLLEGVPATLPALAQAQEIQRRAARVGFDWPAIEGVYEKVAEEISEVRSASEISRAAEIGDLLFAVVNLARWLDVDAESALRQGNSRFRQRFASIERSIRIEDRQMNELSLDEMEAYWQNAKKNQQDTL
jgi:tetrapyrrole methylase family protein/MazG family protein